RYPNRTSKEGLRFESSAGHLWPVCVPNSRDRRHSGSRSGHSTSITFVRARSPERILTFETGTLISFATASRTALLARPSPGGAVTHTSRPPSFHSARARDARGCARTVISTSGGSYGRHREDGQRRTRGLHRRQALPQHESRAQDRERRIERR